MTKKKSAPKKSTPRPAAKPYNVLVDGQPDPGSPYPSKEDAEAALAKRQARDLAVDYPGTISYGVEAA